MDPGRRPGTDFPFFPSIAEIMDRLLKKNFPAFGIIMDETADGPRSGRSTACGHHQAPNPSPDGSKTAGGSASLSPLSLSPPKTEPPAEEVEP